MKYLLNRLLKNQTTKINMLEFWNNFTSLVFENPYIFIGIVPITLTLFLIRRKNKRKIIVDLGSHKWISK